jgi:hypothetical protein
MHKELIILAFEKAKKDTGSEKLTRLSNHLSDFIQEDSGEVYGEKSLRINYNLVRQENEKQIEFKSYVIESLSHYLGYENYLEFVKEKSIIQVNINLNPKDVIKKFLKKNKITLFVSLIIIVGFLLANKVTKQRWMVWQEDHYVKVKFDTDKYNLGQLKLYKEERIKHFKKITPNCTSIFFSDDGKVKVWYGKNIAGKLEYFTSLGLHPETGKALKPITRYMIDKYICDD